MITNRCGDGILGADEACDDGNQFERDGQHGFAVDESDLDCVDREATATTVAARADRDGYALDGQFVYWITGRYLLHRQNLGTGELQTRFFSDVLRRHPCAPSVCTVIGCFLWPPTPMGKTQSGRWTAVNSLMAIEARPSRTWSRANGAITHLSATNEGIFANIESDTGTTVIEFSNRASLALECTVAQPCHGRSLNLGDIFTVGQWVTTRAGTWVTATRGQVDNPQQELRDVTGGGGHFP